MASEEGHFPSQQTKVAYECSCLSLLY